MSENNQKNEAYRYTYSAKQQEEIRAIRKRYLPPEEDKMTMLRRLDAQATSRGSKAALSLGITSCLLMGIGMSCTMVWTDGWFVPGILIGLVGIVGMALAYPLYARITRRERERIAPEIIRLTDELLK